MATSSNFSVFISFQGELRGTFVSHLYEAFLRKGITPFIDSEELQIGEQIDVQLGRIEQSKTAVVVLSENYATSKWCLKELAKILECVEKKRLIVIPVFYSIDVSDVKDLKGTFEEVFKNPKKFFNESELGNVPKWKTALMDVCRLKAFCSMGYRSESDLIKDIVNAVLSKLIWQPSAVREGLFGINTRLKQLEETLRIGSGGVWVVGVVGMTGIGKTTLADCLYRKMRSEFDGFHFCRNVREESKNGTLGQLKKVLLENLLDDNNLDIGASESAHEALKERLLNKKMLIILDDVSDEKQIHCLVGRCNWLREGSRVIITTTEKKLIENLILDTHVDHDTYVVPELHKDEALQLFCYNAFTDHVYPNDEFITLSTKFVDYAKGNPLVLKVLGFHLRHRDNSFWETEFGKLQMKPDWDINKVLEIISDDLGRTLLERNLIGIDSRIQKIESLLSEKSSDVCSLGIWGMAGIGKTSIAKAAYDKISGNFEACFFLHNFEDRFRKDGLYRLRKEFFAEILGEKVLETEDYGLNLDSIGKLWCKKILLVLDDVCNYMDAESLVGGFDWFGRGSLIILTSRDRQVLVRCPRILDIYRVEGLEEAESLQLFSRYAFRKDLPENHFLGKSMEVVKYADGNPLFLELYGKCVNSKTPFDFETPILNLKRSPLCSILDLLGRSYNELDEDEKNIFLDITCFFSGENQVHVKRLLEGCGFFVDIGIKILVDKSLITVSDNGVVEMHNLIKHLGREIVHQESEYPECRSRLWDPSDIRDVLEQNKGTGAIEGMFLDTANLSFDISKKAFENIDNLRLLKIHCTDPGNQPGVRLPEGLECLPDELRLLHWENYPLNFLPPRFDPRNLVELNLPGSRIQKLWEGTKVCLEYLEVLNLSGCSRIEFFPEISPNIKELYLGGTGIREVPPSIENLSRLVKLDLQNCTSLEILPATICKLKYIEMLNLSGCTKLESFPEISEAMKSLLCLDLSETGIKDLPNSFSNLVALKELRMKNYKSLPELPKIIFKLKTLRKVEIRDEIIDWQPSPSTSIAFMVSTPYYLLHMGFSDANEKERTLEDASWNDLQKQLSEIQNLCFGGCVKLQSPLELTGGPADSVPHESMPLQNIYNHYRFINSSGVNRDLVREIFIQDFNRIRQMEEEQPQGFSVTPLFSICLPVTIHQEWLNLVTTGYTAFLRLPHMGCRRDPIWFTFLIEVAFKENFRNDRGFAIRCFCNIKTNDGEYNNLERIFSFWSQNLDESRIEQELMFLFYDCSMHQHLAQGYDPTLSQAEIRFEFFPVDEQNHHLAGCNIKKCAVYMLTTRHENNKVALTMKQSSATRETGTR